MGARGPKPVPTNLLYLRGSRLAKARKDRPETTLAIPECPEYLDEAGKDAWRVLTQALYELGVIAEVDQAALGRYIQLRQRYQKMEAFVRQYGETYPIKDKKGTIVSFQVFPQVYIAGNLAAQLHRIEESFGMSPSSRARIVDKGKIQGEDALDTFLAQKPKRGRPRKALL